MKRRLYKLLALTLGAIIPWTVAMASDYYDASGVPAARSLLNSADMRAEFLAIQTGISDKLPALTGNGDKLVAVNAGGTALTVLSSVGVAQGGTGAATLTGLLQGNGTSAITGITNSSTVGEVLRVTGASTYAWGALDLADGDAITGDLPDANLSSNVPLLDAQNVFTNSINRFSNALPRIQLVESDQAVDEKVWENLVTTSSWVVRTRDDSYANGNVAIQLDRTGTNADLVALTADAIGLTAANGVQVRSVGNTDTEARQVLFTHQDGTTRATLGNVANDTFILRNDINGGPITLSAKDIAGTTRVFFIGDPDTTTTIRADTDFTLEVAGAEDAITAIGDGATSLFYNGFVKFATTNDGVDVTGAIDVDNTDTTIARLGAGEISVEGDEIWNAGNDGSTSGLDADLLDGSEAADFAIMDGGYLIDESISTDIVLSAASFYRDAATVTSFSLPTGLYSFKVVFEMGSSSTPDGQFRLQAPTGTVSASYFTAIYEQSGNTLVSGGERTASNMNPGVTHLLDFSTVSSNLVVIDGILDVTVAATFELQFSQTPSSASTTTLRRGYIDFRRFGDT